MIVVDGSRGEGGGQVVRTCLSLSLLLGRPVTVENVRAGRKKPGLLRQHLTAARAAAEISGGELEGAKLGSSRLTLRPGPLVPGHYRFDVGSAGSATLVLQTLLPPLLTATSSTFPKKTPTEIPTEVTVTGGTHNQKAPTFDYLDRVFLPILRRMGARVSARLERHGFYPAGGGRIWLRVEPVDELRPVDLHERGAETGRCARALLSRLPDHVGEREIRRIARRRADPQGDDWDDDSLSVERVDSPGPGNALVIERSYENVREQFTGFGRRGLPAEKVADEALAEMDVYLSNPAPVGEHLADQLVLPLALAGGGGFSTRALSLHAQTQIERVRELLGTEISVESKPDAVRVTFSSAASGAAE